MRATRLCRHLAVHRLPQADMPIDVSDNDSVEPPPHDRLKPVWCGGNSDQMTRRYPLGSGFEGRGIRHADQLILCENLASAFGRVHDDGGSQF